MLSAIPLLAVASISNGMRSAVLQKGAQTQQAAITISPLKTIEWAKPQAFAAGPRDSLFAAAMEDKSVLLMKAADRTVLQKLVGHPQTPMAVAWSADGTMVATGDESARIITWNAETGAKLLETRGHQRGIQNLAFNFGRTILASTGKDDVVKFWDPGTGRELRSILGSGANFYGGQFRARSDDFGVGTLSGGARVYDMAGQVTANYNFNSNAVFDVAFNAAGTRVATAAREGYASLWDTHTKERLGNFKGHTDWVVHCAFSPNGKWLATSSNDRTVRIWNIYTLQEAARLNDQSAVGSPLCWTPDGKYLVTVNFSDQMQINSVSPAQAGGEPARGRRARRRRR